MNMNVLVTDGENRSSLAVARSLGKKGFRIITTGKEIRNLTSYSKHCYKSFAVADPLKLGRCYATDIEKIVKQMAVDIIVPMTDHSIIILNRIRNSLSEGSILACPTEAKFNSISNKYSLFKLAETLNAPIPKTLFINNTNKLTRLIPSIKSYPVVVKPALSKIIVGDGFISGDVMYASSQKELELLYSNCSALRYPSIIQEMIIGPGTGLFTLYDKNRHLALFSHRRLLEKPPSGGVSVVCESVPLDNEMVEVADAILSSVGWSGVAMVEFKRDQRDGKAKLIEINGRFWGSLQLSIASGVDFPSLYLDYLRGLELRNGKAYLVNQKMKWIFGIIDHLIINLKSDSNRNNNLMYKFKSIFPAINYLIETGKNISTDVFSREDLRPFVYEMKLYLRKIYGLC
jgi:predicted ATP-grasp superfamily ATP-dependent carboligase